MSIFQIFGIAVLFAVLLLIGKGGRLSPLLLVSASLVLVFLAFSRYADVIGFITRTAQTGGLAEETGFILRIACIGILTEIVCGICRDVGEGSLADKLEMCGKAEMLVMTLPMIKSVLELIT